MKMRVALFLLCLALAFGGFVLSFIRTPEVSEEAKIREVFQKEYPDLAIDHVSVDGNMTWGLYYNVWYKKPGDNEARLGICTTHPETKEWGCKAPLFESSK